MQYTNILYGCILGTILDDTNENINYYMFYYNIYVSLIKLVTLDKNNISPPKDKSFYYVKIQKNQLDKIIKEENAKKQENGFINNYYQRTYRGNTPKYYPLMDRYLRSYMQSEVNIDTLKSKNLINDKKKILYDPEYKDFYKYGIPDQEELNKRKLAKFILKKNLSHNLLEKENDYKKEYMSKKPEMKYYLPGINGIPEYIVYLNKKDRKKYLGTKLPVITKRERPKKKKEKKEEKIELVNNAKDRNEEKKENDLKDAGNDGIVGNDEEKANIDTSGYKEIKFQPTQLEQENK